MNDNGSPEPAPPLPPSAVSTNDLSSWQRTKRWFVPPAAPDPLRFNETSDALRERLGIPSAEIAAEILIDAQAAYDEAANRAESAERRATTIQGAIAIAASLALAGGSLLLDSAKVPNEGWRTALAVTFAVAVGFFGIAAWRAFLVTWPRFLWASPAASDIVDHAHEAEPHTIVLRRACDLLIAYGRNDSIARLKVRLLGQAMRWLLAALSVIAALAVMLAVYSSTGTPADTKSNTVSTMHSRSWSTGWFRGALVARPPGSTTRTGPILVAGPSERQRPD